MHQPETVGRDARRVQVARTVMEHTTLARYRAEACGNAAAIRWAYRRERCALLRYARAYRQLQGVA